MDLFNQIDNILELNKAKLLGPVRYKTITNILNRQFNKNHLDFKFRYETFSHVQVDQVSVAGFYDFHLNKKYIIFSFSDLTDNIFTEEEQWLDFKFLITQTCLHENLHQLQFSHRDLSLYEQGKLDFRNLEQGGEEEIEYLIDKDEIDAYAQDLALEIKFYYPTEPLVKIFNNLPRRRYCWSYRYYNTTFKGCDWEVVRKRLLKKTYQWLNRIQIKDKNA